MKDISFNKKTFCADGNSDSQIQILKCSCTTINCTRIGSLLAHLTFAFYASASDGPDLLALSLY